MANREKGSSMDDIMRRYQQQVDWPPRSAAEAGRQDAHRTTKQKGQKH